ncbi:MAG: peptide deformylase [Leptospiraceae bacterium]|nr:peptide deformylase [Leptospiraceae bacterium]
MAVRKILRIGDPQLRQKSAEVPVTEIRSSEIKKLIRDMYDSMEAAEGVGLAAPQIGVLKRVVVVGFYRSERYPELKNGIEHRVLINPEIEVLDSPKVGFWEGCLSVPDMRGYVERQRKIRLKFYDEKEEFHDEIIEGFDAVVYQHECDHLDGILYVDRLADPTMFGYNDELDMADRKAGKEPPQVA